MKDVKTVDNWKMNGAGRKEQTMTDFGKTNLSWEVHPSLKFRRQQRLREEAGSDRVQEEAKRLRVKLEVMIHQDKVFHEAGH